ncbi:MAG: hypothetical protein HYS44_00750 [Candidatus Niyogibacteria bacterium]|nr:hypothetical protein [Candidatus Niyogibacteria bacterium]
MNEQTTVPRYRFLAASILVSSFVLAGAWLYTAPRPDPLQNTAAVPDADIQKKSVLEEKVLPSDGIALPVRWGDLGIKMAGVGVVDREKFEALYANHGEFDLEARRLFGEEMNEPLRMTPENAGLLLNLFWALGLGTKNDILEQGPIADPKYGGADTFASTAGWTIAQGDPMNHYSRHPFVLLTKEQQDLVRRVSKNIYRPCCPNPVYFPDCNHGMAMLGFLELMASQGVSEQDMWKAALAVNSYWFPDTYITIATYMKNKGVPWEKVNPREMLGINYSSASGYARIAAQAQLQPQRGGSGCGVDTGQQAEPQRERGGCSI